MIRVFTSGLCVCLLAIAAQPARAQNWLETSLEIGQLTDAGAYREALELARELIERATNEFGTDSEQLAQSHMVIAELEMADRDWIAAEDHLISAIQTYERLDGPMAPSLIEPYTGLGDAYLAGEEFELAIRAYNEARGISRRNFGLNNVIQAPLVYREATVVEEMGDVDAASELRVEAVQIVQRFYGVASQESLAGLIDLAGWFSEHHFHVAAGNQYLSAANLLQYTLEGDDFEVIRLLRLSAENLRLGANEFDNPEFISTGGGRRPSELMNALGIVRDMEDADEHLLLQAELWLEIGDWYIAFSARDSVAEAYLRAIDLLTQIENGDRIREQWFSTAVQVQRGSFHADELSIKDDALTGRVELEIEIKDNGTVGRAEVISSDPEGLLEREARRHVSNSRFRPNVVDGQVVGAVRRYTVEYRYDPDLIED